jgi:hypothetical protein
MESDNIAHRGALMGIDEYYIPVDEVRIILDYVPGTVIAVFDSCLSGQFIQTRSRGGADPPADPNSFNEAVISAFSEGSAQSRSLTDHGNSSKYRILTAAASLQSSYSVTLTNGKYVGLMTYFFARGAGVDAISGTGKAYADADKNKAITLNEMYAYIRNSNLSSYINGRKQDIQAWPASSSEKILTVP